MKKLHVAQSPLTNIIYAGSVSKNGNTWLSNKTDVTHEAIGAVAEHALEKGETLVVNKNGKPFAEICVKALQEGPSNTPTTEHDQPQQDRQ